MASEVSLDPYLDRPIYGAAAIGRVVDLTPRQASYALEMGYLPADKFGGRWVSTPRRLRSIAAGSTKRDAPHDP